MIRIDEIYNGVFWPWLAEHRNIHTNYYHYPFGQSSLDSIHVVGFKQSVGNPYIVWHDQEPIHVDLHSPVFNKIHQEQNITPYINLDLVDKSICNDYNNHINNGGTHTEFMLSNRDTLYHHVIPAPLNDLTYRQGHIIVSEKGEYVKQIEDQYWWRTHYYFFHGWAALDWYRGYNRSFLITPPEQRQPTRTFFSANRIVGGQRDHRVLLLYQIFKQGLSNNWISAPRTCPVEQVNISQIAQRYNNHYPDIVEVVDHADLPRTFPGETTQEMSSYQLTNFQECADSLLYVATETVFFGQRLHLTEKTFKPIALGMPFVLLAPAGSLEYLRSYGFQTFGNIIDESYDTETDDLKRIERVADLLAQLNALSQQERQQLHRAMLPTVEHNRNHFYNGAFEQILWQELTQMLESIHV